MTTEVKKQLSWWGLLAGIPLAVVIGWVFYAGGTKASIDNAININTEQTQQIHRHEARLIRIETLSERTGQDISEIKQILKSRP